jgi:hypothetical protein
MNPDLLTAWDLEPDKITYNLYLLDGVLIEEGETEHGAVSGGNCEKIRIPLKK